MALAQTAAGKTMSLTNKAVSLVACQRPVAAERVSTSRWTRITARTWPAHSVSAKASPGVNTSTSRASWRERRFLSTVRALMRSHLLRVFEQPAIGEIDGDAPDPRRARAMIDLIAHRR